MSRAVEGQCREPYKMAKGMAACLRNSNASIVALRIRFQDYHFTHPLFPT